MKDILQAIGSPASHSDKQYLIDLVDEIRQSSTQAEQPWRKIKQLIALLRNDAQHRDALRTYLRSLVGAYDPTQAYSKSGILPNKGFFGVLRRKIEYRLLPPAKDSNDLELLISDVFHKSDDYEWVQAMPLDLITDLLTELDFHRDFNTGATLRTLIGSIQILSHQLVTLSVEPDIFNRLPLEDNLHSPFMEQNKEITLFIEEFKEYHFSKLENEKFEGVLAQLDQCEANIEWLIENKPKYGTSLHQTYLIRRMRQIIQRMRLLLRLFHEDVPIRFNKNLANLIKELVCAENQKYHIRTYLGEQLEFLSFQIVSHTAKKGESYIAENRKQYGKFLLRSMYGGLLIAIFACFKVIMDSWDTSPLGSAILFSLNYATCFVLVGLTGGIIATKQPAMTASAIAGSMEQTGEVSNPVPNLHRLTATIVRVSNSQFISFVGNLICAFPLAFLISYGLDHLLGVDLITDYKAEKLVAGIHPYHSLSLWYAAIAGVFLSLSGIISGYFDNKVVYGNLANRIEQVDLLSRFLGQERLHTLASYVEEKLGKFMGNFTLGIFLGSAGIVGYISGLPIDIRHIAFSSGNFGFAFETLGPKALTGSIAISLAGVAGIGLINFVVSFGITLFIAMRSRQITFNQSRTLAWMVLRHFLKRPFDFFIAPNRKLSTSA